ncbi:zinc finger, CCHC-type, retrotransposon gag domain protein [Tanacetum coccineum]
MVEKFIQKFYQLSDDNEEMEADEDDDPDDIDEIFKIEGNLFDFETPLCKAFNEFNYLLKIDTDLFTFYIQGIRFYEEYELNNNTGDLEEPWSDNGVPYQLCDRICEPYHFNNGMTKWPTCSSDIYGFCNGGKLPGMVRVGCMTYFQDHKWYDKLADGKLKEETLMHKAKVEESWGGATPGVINYRANNIGDTQECQEHKKEHKGNKHTESSKSAHDPSKCQVRRFEMIKYSFDANDELQYGVSLGLGYNVLTTYIDLAVRKSTICTSRVKKGGMMNDFRNEMATYCDFTACDVPKFDGPLDPIACTKWLSAVEGAFRTSCCKEKIKGEEWIGTCTWKEFKEMFNSKYAMAKEVDKIQEEFQTLTQTNETVNEIWKKFNDLIRYCPEYHGNEILKVERFQRMPHDDIREVISPFKCTTLDDLLSRARVRKADLLRRKSTETNETKRKLEFGDRYAKNPK